MAQRFDNQTGGGELKIVQHQELTNSFRVPVTLYSAAIDDPRFTVLGFEPGMTIAPNATVHSIQVMYKGPPDGTISHRMLAIQSNVAAELFVPIWTFHGKLGVARVDSVQWRKFVATYADSGLRGWVNKMVAVCDGRCATPKFSVVAATAAELSEIAKLVSPSLDGRSSAADDVVSWDEETLNFGTLTGERISRFFLF